MTFYKSCSLSEANIKQNGKHWSTNVYKKLTITFKMFHEKHTLTHKITNATKDKNTVTN